MEKFNSALLLNFEIAIIGVTSLVGLAITLMTVNQTVPKPNDNLIVLMII
jgi:hypothetical protein